MEKIIGAHYSWALSHNTIYFFERENKPIKQTNKNQQNPQQNTKSKQSKKGAR